ncbi:MAG: hypothetical protein HY814_05515, partial [Candidatus Riflebacteria bacterium]|nr:hypothetical protein [Candidatus Riflebacteria bacterium]
TTRPDAGFAPNMVYDSARGCCVLFGGHNGSISSGATWEYTRKLVGALTFSRAPALLRPGNLKITASFDVDLSSNTTPTLTFPTGGTYFGVNSVSRVGFRQVLYDVTVGLTPTSGAADYVASVQRALGTGGPNQATPATQAGTVDTGPLSVLLTYDRDPAFVLQGPLTITATFSQPLVTTLTFALDAPGTANDVPATPMTGRGAVWTYTTNITGGSANLGPATVTIAGGQDTTGYINQTATDNTFTVASPPSYDGAPYGWAPQAPSTKPQGRRHAAMAFDSARSRSVMFGGNNGRTWIGDTWEYDGTNWISFTPATAPSVRDGPGMAYDQKRGRTVIFGGHGTSAEKQDTWEWDGTNWQRAITSGGPSKPLAPAMCFDSTRNCGVLFGGYAD